MSSKYFLKFGIVFTIISITFFVVILILRYQVNNISPGFTVREIDSLSNLNFILEKGNIKNAAKNIKLVNKFQSNYHSDDYNEIFCIKLTNCPFELNDKGVWYNYPINDSGLTEVLEKTLSFDKSPEDVEVLLNELDVNNIEKSNLEWIPTMNDLNEHYLIAFDSLEITDNKIDRSRMLIFNKEEFLLFYFNVSFK